MKTYQDEIQWEEESEQNVIGKLRPPRNYIVMRNTDRSRTTDPRLHIVAEHHPVVNNQKRKQRKQSFKLKYSNPEDD